jgi:hypothetical protein
MFGAVGTQGGRVPGATGVGRVVESESPLAGVMSPWANQKQHLAHTLACAPSHERFAISSNCAKPNATVVYVLARKKKSMGVEVEATNHVAHPLAMAEWGRTNRSRHICPTQADMACSLGLGWGTGGARRMGCVTPQTKHATGAVVFRRDDSEIDAPPPAALGLGHEKKEEWRKRRVAAVRARASARGLAPCKPQAGWGSASGRSSWPTYFCKSAFKLLLFEGVSTSTRAHSLSSYNKDSEASSRRNQCQW